MLLPCAPGGVHPRGAQFACHERLRTPRSRFDDQDCSPAARGVPGPGSAAMGRLAARHFRASAFRRRISAAGRDVRLPSKRTRGPWPRNAPACPRPDPNARAEDQRDDPPRIPSRRRTAARLSSLRARRQRTDRRGNLGADAVFAMRAKLVRLFEVRILAAPPLLR
jgi:hypothetical protein